MKHFWLLAVITVFVAGAVWIAACSDADDDDNDSGDDDTDGLPCDYPNELLPCEDCPASITGTMNYQGAADTECMQIMIAITDQWPMTTAPLYFNYVNIPPEGFPFTYSAPLDRTGPLYVLALIDIDPDDGVGMNPDIDPLAIPTAITAIIPGENHLDFTFIDPSDLADDDTSDDDAADDDTIADDDTAIDDDTVSQTGVQGTISYGGSATGENVVFGFWDSLPMGPPDHSFSVEVPETGFPFNYQIPTDFTGDWRIVAFLDVNPNDGDSINFDTDPNNWALNIQPTTIVEGTMVTADITLIDP